MLASDLVRALANRCLRDIFFVRRSDVWPPSIVKTHVCASDEDESMLDAPSRRQHRGDFRRSWVRMGSAALSNGALPKHC